jgi:hypothetical protein
VSQSQSPNPFRPGSGVFPPLLAGRELQTSIFGARAARALQGHPQHTALLGEWAMGKTTLLVAWRRARIAVGDAVVLSMAYPQTPDSFLAGLAAAVDFENESNSRVEVEVGFDFGVASAKVRRPGDLPERDLARSLRKLARRQLEAHRATLVFIDDVSMLAGAGDVLLRLRALALELYAAELPVTFVVAGAPSLFSEVRAAHEPLVRFFEPLTVGPLNPSAAEDAVAKPLERANVEFDLEVVIDIVRLSGGRPYYLQKLAYHAYDNVESGRLSRHSFAVAFEQAFAAISQEIFAARWASMSVVDQRVLAFLARSAEPRASNEVESELRAHAVRPSTTRQALRRLTARGQIGRVVETGRGRYLIGDRLFQRFVELRQAER